MSPIELQLTYRGMAIDNDIIIVVDFSNNCSPKGRSKTVLSHSYQLTRHTLYRFRLLILAIMPNTPQFYKEKLGNKPRLAVLIHCNRVFIAAIYISMLGANKVHFTCGISLKCIIAMSYCLKCQS